MADERFSSLLVPMKNSICMKKSSLVLLAFLFVVGISLQAQEGEGAQSKRSKGPKAYEKVVTETAETDTGLFTVH